MEKSMSLGGQSCSRLHTCQRRRRYPYSLPELAANGQFTIHPSRDRAGHFVAVAAAANFDSGGASREGVLSVSVHALETLGNGSIEPRL
jgi:hypothetical protein